jgi:hypothetical protein
MAHSWIWSATTIRSALSIYIDGASTATYQGAAIDIDKRGSFDERQVGNDARRDRDSLRRPSAACRRRWSTRSSTPVASSQMSSGRSARTSGHGNQSARRVRRRPSVEAEAPEYLREALVDVVTARPADQVAATLPAVIAPLHRRRTRGGAAQSASQREAFADRSS